MVIIKRIKQTNETFVKVMDFARIITSSVFDSAKIHRRWTPVQSGIMLSSTSFVDLTRNLLEEGVRYVLSARYNQDALESFFGTVRRHCGITGTCTASDAFRIIKFVNCAEHVSAPSCQSIMGYDKIQNSASYKTRPLFDQQPSMESATNFEQSCLQESNSMLLSIGQNEQHEAPFIKKADKTSIIDHEALYYICGSAAHSLLNNHRYKNSNVGTNVCQLCDKCRKLLDPQDWFSNESDSVKQHREGECIPEAARYTKLRNRGSLYMVLYT